ncbi:MAG: type II toxin-antitoxin system HicB family antitoxin [Methylococcaceae bacterium]|nr:type II toxin-antitoxin system HicB family antitoxin [Methylococcaceae bacterium]
MLYSVYVHVGDGHHSHCVTIPDFPGCFSAADDWDLLPVKVQGAIELYCEGEDMDIPLPTSLEKLMSSPEYEGGAWLLVDVDVSRLSTKPVRINISLPENLVHSIDDYAKTHHLTRSCFLVRAALAEIQKAS